MADKRTPPLSLGDNTSDNVRAIGKRYGTTDASSVKDRMSNRTPFEVQRDTSGSRDSDIELPAAPMSGTMGYTTDRGLMRYSVGLTPDEMRDAASNSSGIKGTHPVHKK